MPTTTRTYAILPGLLTAALTLTTPALRAADAPVVPTLAGAWKAQEMKVPASTDLDREVWGAGASKVRNVQLLLEKTGSGTLRIASSVVDRQGRPKKFSQSVIEARIQVTEPAPGNDRVQPVVTVVSAQEHFLDDPKDVRTIDGLRLKLDLASRESRDLNLFYETADGNGSFGETLRRQTPARASSASAATPSRTAQPRG